MKATVSCHTSYQIHTRGLSGAQRDSGSIHIQLRKPLDFFSEELLDTLYELLIIFRRLKELEYWFVSSSECHVLKVQLCTLGGLFDYQLECPILGRI